MIPFISQSLKSNDVSNCDIGDVDDEVDEVVVDVCMVVVVTDEWNDVCVDDCVDIVRSDGDDIDNFTLAKSDNMGRMDTDVVVVVMCVVVCVDGVVDDDVVVVVTCVEFCDDVSVVLVECDMDDSNARARCRVDGGLILGMIMLMGTEIRVRLISQYTILRDNHMV